MYIFPEKEAYIKRVVGLEGVVAFYVAIFTLENAVHTLKRKAII